LVGRFGPFEGLGILVVPIDERTDIGFELPDGGMNTSPEPLSGELSESKYARSSALSTNGAIGRPLLPAFALQSSERSSIMRRTCIPDD
jgi:hypothetical protein